MQYLLYKNLDRVYLSIISQMARKVKVWRGMTREEIYARMGGAGEVSEWLKEHAWKACMRATVSGVRIPISPPFIVRIAHVGIFLFIVFMVKCS